LANSVIVALPTIAPASRSFSRDEGVGSRNRRSKASDPAVVGVSRASTLS
jgi:hypothetical protein